MVAPSTRSPLSKPKRTLSSALTLLMRAGNTVVEPRLSPKMANVKSFFEWSNFCSWSAFRCAGMFPGVGAGALPGTVSVPVFAFVVGRALFPQDEQPIATSKATTTRTSTSFFRTTSVIFHYFFHFVPRCRCPHAVAFRAPYSNNNAMKTLRTPDDRFADLPGYPFAPHYLEVPDTEGGRLSCLL